MVEKWWLNVPSSITSITPIVRGYFWREPKCLLPFSQEHKMTSAAHLWQESFQLYPSVISEFLRAGSHSRRWPLGRRDRTAGQGQSYCTVMHQLLSIQHKCPKFGPQVVTATTLQDKLYWNKKKKEKKQHAWERRGCKLSFEILWSSLQQNTNYCPCLCVWRAKAGGESGCWEKHRPEKIHFNLPNARAGLLTFSNWYFPWNSIGSLHNFIIKPHLIASDYAQHDCSHTEIWVYVFIKSANTETFENVERLERQMQCIICRTQEQTALTVSFNTWLNRSSASAEIF